MGILTMMVDAEGLKRRLEKVGEEKVRERLANNIYSFQDEKMVKEWLLSKEINKSDREMAEYINIARSAKYAAWIAATAAIISSLAALASWIR